MLNAVLGGLGAGLLSWLALIGPGRQLTRSTSSAGTDGLAVLIAGVVPAFLLGAVGGGLGANPLYYAGCGALLGVLAVGLGVMAWRYRGRGGSALNWLKQVGFFAAFAFAPGVGVAALITFVCGRV